MTSDPTTGRAKLAAGHPWAVVRLSLFLGWNDVRLMYRRTVLGQFWITLTMAITFGAIGSVFGLIFRSNVVDYLPFLGAGLVLFTYLSALLNEGTTGFINAEGFVKQLPLPPVVFFLKVVWRAIIIFFHNAVALVILFAFYPQQAGWIPLLALPGFLISTLGMGGLGLALAMFATRFRDVPQVVASVVQILFYLTPIVWLPTSIPEAARGPILTFNPLYHFIEVIRAPLLGTVPPLSQWAVTSGIALVFLAIGVGSYAWKRHQLAFWL